MLFYHEILTDSLINLYESLLKNFLKGSLIPICHIQFLNGSTFGCWTWGSINKKYNWQIFSTYWLERCQSILDSNYQIFLDFIITINAKCWLSWFTEYRALYNSIFKIWEIKKQLILIWILKNVLNSTSVLRYLLHI